MDTELLRTFIEVSKTRHFGRASENLYLTQSAVSFRIRQLENQLGISLFTRQRGNIQLTAAGERLQPYAESILQAWGRAKQDVALTDSYEEQLTIGATSACWELHGIADWLNDIYAQKPHLVLRVESTDRQSLARALVEKRFDIALTSEPPKIEGLKSRQLMEYELTLVASKPDMKLEDTGTLPLVYLDWGTRFAMEHAKIPALQRTPVLHTHSPQLAINHLLSQQGVAYMPSVMVERYIEEKLLFRIEDAEALPQQLFMIWQDDTEKSDLINSLSVQII
ncbi:HTH-type transcriptional regulator HdfR [Parasalinivibrio latis]|uniref:HTH-type transcriptional regulator HdfR n=1 Tax=Parasalinivibrio latis TaxID=2952610 RepID=UPI0030E58C21